VPKYRMIHDQTYMALSGLSVNIRTIKERLPPCVYGRVLLRLTHYIVDLRAKHPNRKILVGKYDLKSAYRWAHLSGPSAAECLTIFEGRLYASLCFTFGGTPFPNLWSAHSEIITDLANDLIQCEEWDELLSIKKTLGEGQMAETRIVLGWQFWTRSLQIDLPQEKYLAWTADIQNHLSMQTVDLDTLDTTVGRLNHVGLLLPPSRHFHSRLRNLVQKGKDKNRRWTRVPSPVKADLRRRSLAFPISNRHSADHHFEHPRISRVHHNSVDRHHTRKDPSTVVHFESDRQYISRWLVIQEQLCRNISHNTTYRCTPPSQHHHKSRLLPLLTMVSGSGKCSQRRPLSSL